VDTKQYELLHKAGKGAHAAVSSSDMHTRAKASCMPYMQESSTLEDQSGCSCSGAPVSASTTLIAAPCRHTEATLLARVLLHTGVLCALKDP
jgi:hypothetical protein